MFKCQECEYTSPDWLGKCPNCQEFGTIEETSSEEFDTSASPTTPDSVETRSLTDVESQTKDRLSTGLSELDRVLGGGLVPGSVVLLGGPPGIGKSTLLLQWGSSWNPELGPVLYVNGEESGTQIARRSDRIDARTDNIEILTIDTIEALTENLDELQPSLVVIDSIQTVTSEDSSGTPGSVAQLRALTQTVVQAAKRNHVPFVLVGHVTKKGDIGGPKRLEHMVDTVLYFDDSEQGFRFIRSAKNRFGPTGELGIFEMTGAGLEPIKNPGEYFSDGGGDQTGRALTVSLEGSRPLLVEIQALVTPSQYGNPQRSGTGLPSERLIMIIAVLEKHLDLPLGIQDVFVNVAGGLQLDDPGTDMAVAMSIISSFENTSLPDRSVWMGELGLTGRLRNPSQAERRVREAKRLDSEPVILGGEGVGKSIESVKPVTNIGHLINRLESVTE